MSNALSLHNHRAGVPAAVQLHPEHDEVRCKGDWTALCLTAAETRLQQLDTGDRTWRIDASGIRRLDSAGALALRDLQAKLGRPGHPASLVNLSPIHAALLNLIDSAHASPQDQLDASTTAAHPPAVRWSAEVLAALEFLGTLTRIGIPHLLRPWRLRYRRIAAELQQAGVQALPIIGLLTFLMGGVIAFQGGVALRQYGASVFLVDLVGITMLREMAPSLAAVVVAGRTGAAYTAEIGAMKTTQEV